MKPNEATNTAVRKRLPSRYVSPVKPKPRELQWRMFKTKSVRYEKTETFKPTNAALEWFADHCKRYGITTVAV